MLDTCSTHILYTCSVHVYFLCDFFRVCLIEQSQRQAAEIQWPTDSGVAALCPMAMGSLRSMHSEQDLFDGPQSQVVALGSGGASGSGDADLAAVALEVEEVPVANCDFNCGVVKPVAELFKTNSRASPVCHPCHAARRAVLAAAVDKRSKQAIADLQKNDPEGWKAKVRLVRVDPDSGPVDYAQRRAAIHTLIQQLVQKSGIEHSCEIVWLTKAKFIARMVRDEMMPVEAATERWGRMLADPSVEKMQQPGEEIRLPVQEDPRTRVYRAREMSASVASSSGIRSSAETQQALNQLAMVGTAMGSFTSPLMGDFGAVCRPGASGSSTGIPLPKQSASAPPTDMVIPKKCFQGPVPAVNPTGGRALTRQSSAQDDEAAGQKKRPRFSGPAALGGVTGELRQLRANALAVAKALVDRFGKGKAHMARELAAAARKSEITLSEQMQAAISQYNHLVDTLKRQPDTIKNWTVASAASGFEHIQQWDTQLCQLAELCQQGLQECTAARERTRKTAAQQKAVEVKIRQRASAAYSSCPDPLIRFLYASGALVAKDEKDKDGSGELKSRMTVVGADAEFFDVATPALFALKANGEPSGHAVSGLVECIGKQRFAHATEQIRGACAKNGVSTNKRLEPRGQPHDTLERMEWVPEAWRNGKYNPEALRELGAPYCLGLLPGSAVHGDGGWPAVGVGQFIYVQSGQLTACLWPVHSTLARGATIGKQWKFLYKQMGSKAFSEWADDNMMYSLVKAGETIWVPYGWYGSIIARTELGTSMAVAMVQPCVTAAMARECSEWAVVSNYLACFLEAKVEAKVQMYQDWASKSIEWLRNTASMESCTGSASGQPLAACLEDAPKEEEQETATVPEDTQLPDPVGGDGSPDNTT